MTGPKLKRCPFCGGEAEAVHTGSGADYVRCKECLVRTRNYQENDVGPAMDWNARVEHPEPGKALWFEGGYLCSRCFGDVAKGDCFCRTCGALLRFPEGVPTACQRDAPEAAVSDGGIGAPSRGDVPARCTGEPNNK